MPVRLFRYRSCFKSLSFSCLFPLFFLLNHQQLNYHLPCCYKHTYPNQFFSSRFFLLFFLVVSMPSCMYIKIPIIKIYRFAWVKLTIQQLRKRINNFFFVFLLPQWICLFFSFLNAAFYRCTVATTPSSMKCKKKKKHRYFERVK